METDSSGIIHRLDLKDDQTFRLGDAIDVKASIALVVITFLATQTGSFLSVGGRAAELPLWSAFALAIAGALAVSELWPRDYEIEATEGLDGWIQELGDYYRHDDDADSKVAEAVRSGHIARTKERIEANARINQRKSVYLTWSFRFTAIALVLNLVTLILRAWG